MIIRLPIPPSTNNLFKNAGRKRIKTDGYKTWIAEAQIAYLNQKRWIEREEIKGDYEVAIKLPKIKGDIDNRIKGPIDFLVQCGITPDDRYLRKVSVEIDEQSQTNECWLTITAREGA